MRRPAPPEILLLGIFQVLFMAILVIIVRFPEVGLIQGRSQLALLSVVCVVKPKQPIMLLPSPNINYTCIKTLLAYLIKLPQPILAPPAYDSVH